MLSILNWNRLLLVILPVMLCNLGYGQTKKSKTKLPQYSILAITNQNRIKGELLKLDDESIVVQKLNDQRLEIHVQHIQELRFREKGSVGKGMLIGGITGMGVGAFLGYLSGDDPPGTWIRFSAERKAVAFGGFLAIPGIITGGLIGSKCIKISIENKQSLYNKKKLKRFVR